MFFNPCLRVYVTCLFFFTFFQRHDECVDQEPTECTCGPHRDHILPPWAIYPVIKVRHYPLTHCENKQCLSHWCSRKYLPRAVTVSPVWCSDRYRSMELWKCIGFFSCLFNLGLFFRSLKERPNNVKNGCSASMDDSELNTTPDGQVLQVVLSLRKAFINIKASISCKTYVMFSTHHVCLSSMS